MDDILDPFFYPWWALVYFFILYSGSHAVIFLLSKFHPSALADLNLEKTRNAVTYILELVVTSIALFGELYGGYQILFQGAQSVTSQAQMNWMLLAVQAIPILYIWELIYRERMGWPLFVHHMVTILLTQLVTASFYEEKRIIYLRCALIFGFHATTEQLSFIALLFYRLKILPKWHSSLYFASAAQSFVVKSAVTLWIVVVFAKDYLPNFDQAQNSPWRRFWVVCFFPLIGVLYGSQVYACYILYTLGCRTRVHANKASDDDSEDVEAAVVVSVGCEGKAFNKDGDGGASNSTLLTSSSDDDDDDKGNAMGTVYTEVEETRP